MDLSFQNLGAHPSPPDYRDFKDPSLTLAPFVPVTYQTDISQIVVTNQKKLGICTSNLAIIIEWLYWKKTGVYVRLSRRFLYSVTKNLIDENAVEGSSPRSALKAAYNYGICTEATFPSDTDGFSHAEYIDINAIPPGAWLEAKKYQIGGYVPVPTDRDSMRAGIFKYGLIYTRMEIGKEWWTSPAGVPSWDPRDINPLRRPAEVVSGHATVDSGFDEVFHAKRNSWSEAWNLHGDATFNPSTYPTTEAWGVTLDHIVNDLPPAGEFKHSFSTPLQKGQRSEEVKNLQIALMIGGDMDFVQPADRGYYGSLTQAGVLRYQMRRIAPLSWVERYVYAGAYCGPKTLKALSEDFK